MLIGCFACLYGYIEYMKYMGWARMSHTSAVSLPNMAAFLHDTECREYTGMFKKEGIDVETLLLMEPGHLKELGLKVGPRVRLEQAIADEKTRLWAEDARGKKLRISEQSLQQLRNWGVGNNVAKPTKKEV